MHVRSPRRRRSVRRPSEHHRGDCLGCQSHPRWCIQRVPPRPQAGSSRPRFPARRHPPFSDPQKPANPSHRQSSARAPAPHLASARRLFDQGQRRRRRSMWPRPEAKARENAGGADVPGIRNYEGVRAVVEGPEANSFWVTLTGVISPSDLRYATPSATRMGCRRHFPAVKQSRPLSPIGPRR